MKTKGQAKRKIKTSIMLKIKVTTTITCERFPLVHTGHFVIETA